MKKNIKTIIIITGIIIVIALLLVRPIRLIDIFATEGAVFHE